MYRISCSLVCSYGLLTLTSYCWPVTHHMFLGVFLVIAIFFTWLFVWGIKSTAWIYGFRSVARIVSAIYLVLQAIALVDFAFTLHDIITAKMEETNVRSPSLRYLLEALQVHRQDVLLREPVDVHVPDAFVCSQRRLRRRLHLLVASPFLSHPATSSSASTVVSVARTRWRSRSRY